MSAFNASTNGGFTFGMRYIKGGNSDGGPDYFFTASGSSGSFFRLGAVVAERISIEYKNPDGTMAIEYIPVNGPGGWTWDWAGKNIIIRVSGTTMTIFNDNTYGGLVQASVTISAALANLMINSIDLGKMNFGGSNVGYSAVYLYDTPLSGDKTTGQIKELYDALSAGSGFPSGEFFGIANPSSSTRSGDSVSAWDELSQATSANQPQYDSNGWIYFSGTKTMTATSFGGGGGGGGGGSGGGGGGSGASAAIESSTLATYISGSASTSVELATEVRTAIKALTDATAKATAKAAYISAMRTKEPSLKIAVPQTEFIAYIGTFSSVPAAIEAAPKPIDVILPSASNIVDITTASVDETKYTAIEMPVNTTMTVKDNGSTVGTLTYDGSVYTDGNGATYSVGNSIIFGTKKVTILGQGSALVEITNTYKSIEVNLNVEISANGTLEVLGYQPAAPSNIVIASTLLPVDALYDSGNNIALIEFWEPDNLDDIMAQLASTQTLGGVEGYRITAKKLALGLQNCLIGSLDAKSAEPFNAAPKYGAAGVQNGNRVMTGFGRFALMAYAHYIMGHVQATAAITNDTDFMKGMLSLNSDTLTDYKYASVGNYDDAAAPWTTAGDASDANLAVRLVKALIDNNPTTSLVSNGAATTVANIVKQVVGQDASRATDEDNNKYSPENHGLLRFYPDDVIYVSINLTTPTVTVGTGQLVSGPTMEDLYSNATGDKKYTIKLTLGPAA
jgi:hypothetical protein